MVRYFVRTALPILASLVLAGCVTMTNQPSAPDARARLVDARGADNGFAEMFAESDMLRVELAARGLAAGTYAVSLHATGQCAGRGFARTGGPITDAPALDPLTVEPGLIGRQSYRLPAALRDGDGFALIVHMTSSPTSAPRGCAGLR